MAFKDINKSVFLQIISSYSNFILVDVSLFLIMTEQSYFVTGMLSSSTIAAILIFPAVLIANLTGFIIELKNKDYVISPPQFIQKNIVCKILFWLGLIASILMTVFLIYCITYVIAEVCEMYS